MQPTRREDEPEWAARSPLDNPLIVVVILLVLACAVAGAFLVVV